MIVSPAAVKKCDPAKDNAQCDFNLKPVGAGPFIVESFKPKEAITMGVATILEAREVAILATGEHKADIVRRAVEGPVDTEVAATFLQRHPNTTFYLDGAAAATLTRVGTSLRELRPPNPRGRQL